ncbi:MAG: class I SAM-dependent methyltransferase [Candidatus Aquirickettsiella gammari]
MNKPVPSLTEDAQLNSRIAENGKTSYGGENHSEQRAPTMLGQHQKQFGSQRFPSFPSSPHIIESRQVYENSGHDRPTGFFAVFQWRLRMAARPGIGLKERIRQLPLIGYSVAWINALIKLPVTRHHHTVELAYLHQELSVLRSQLVQLNHRVTQVEPFVVQMNTLLESDLLHLEKRVQLVENLQVGTRLMKLEQQETARKIKQFTELLRHAQREAIVTSEQYADLKLRLANLESGANFARKVTPPIVEAQTATSINSTMLDDFFLDFEETFRGDRAEIKERLRVYLPYITSTPVLQSGTWVDVGCGRGEWLELLADAGMTALGIDLNAAKVDACIELGYAAKVADAIVFLQSQPEGSLAGVTGFHLIEHLPFEKLLALFDAALHALMPGGMIIFETPNPENLLVGSCNFYFDPTHLHPIVPDVAKFMATQRGFSAAEILRLHPYPDDHLVDAETNVGKTLNRYLFGAQDYALIARK